MYYKTYQYNGCEYNNKTLETLEKNPDAVTIIDNDMIIIIINNIEMYVFPINTIYDSKYVKYTPISTNTSLTHGLELWYTDDELLYPTQDSLQLLYTKTIEILNNN
jgi:hypothetical protein